ncbi:hypothetical protein BELL_0038g00240 [Botrytis elliptica]|uniref:Uncharacterized protein n=1 Tax=Botrytis elliptica TaxID=278938 RepID=A0A4Z1K126_9HELO|nr:hypothetical protein EAE99_001905 [Botrytis elliptica]TGO79276.1 hypothetical protein BELL_0038g00240 [Botrytis elliptica]
MLSYAQRENARQRQLGSSVDIVPQTNDSYLKIGGIPKQIYGLATPQVVEMEFCTSPLSNYSDLEIEENLEQTYGSTLAPVGVNSLRAHRQMTVIWKARKPETDRRFNLAMGLSWVFWRAHRQTH